MIVQNFDLQLLNKDEAEIEMAVTLKPKGGVPAKLAVRSR